MNEPTHKPGEHEPSADVIGEVRAFYEQHPYPAPLTDLDSYREQWEEPGRRRADFHLRWPAQSYRDELDILVAGCGTSQAARHALREPNSRVTGIDISEASLDHTRMLKEKYELDNLELHQLPLEQVNSLGCHFDKIVCTGVLHHLPDPEAGLTALRSVLSTNGAMHLMVYAAYGRTGVYMLQDYCRRLGVRATEDELAELGAMLGVVQPEHPLADVLRRAKDLRTPAAMADALLHPQDRAYTVPELYYWLETCGISFGRWQLQAPYLARCGLLADTPHSERLTLLAPSEQYAAVELLRGTMVKHEFVAYRDDLPDPPRPIQFNDDRWLQYVPIRLPGTVTVKERLPEGAVAVILNPIHAYTDIYLSIDEFEDRILNAIDGERRIDSILRRFADDSISRDRARVFFEQLWFYDQVVFDASMA